MSQERIHGGGKQGRASVTCSPDRGGMHSLIGAIDTPCSFGTVLLAPKRACIVPIAPPLAKEKHVAA